ncbi:MAG TPA: TetR/AcrR family transcriptional regulator [Thermoleophilaceae bacterium]|jgi:AcrR family transcriptional regulator|nr:TetR/AcrR family transcriptional regulator [Thermoleophilaceae bacterium]
MSSRDRRRAERAEDRVAQKMDQARQKMEAARRKVEAAEQRVERKLQRTERELERTMGPVWARAEPGSRRARFTRDQIAEVALRIADAEGIDAVSMRRVAGELGAGTMTLYHYVQTKDELLALMDNAMMGELIVPDDELSADWREALTQIAHRSRAALLRHPWALEGIGDAYIGPNAIRHMEQSMAAVSAIEGDFSVKFEIVEMIDEYVFGNAIHGSRAPGPEDPEAQEEWREQAFAFIEEQLATGDFPHLTDVMPPGGMPELWEKLEAANSDDDRFDRGLRRVLDGIQLELERRSA